MILIHLFFILVALLSPLSLSSPVAPFPRHRKLHSHRLSPRHVFDLPYSRDRSQPTIAPSNPQVTALPDEEVPTITIVDPPVGPTLTLEVSAPSSSLTIASASKPTSNIVISPTEAKVTTQPQELLLSVLPNILLFGGSYRFTFSSWASDSGLLIVGLSGLLILIHFIVTKSALSAQFKMFLISCGLLFVASTFSLLQMGAADKEGHKLNVPLFVLSQLHFTVATIGFAVWHLMLINDLDCWPSLTRRLCSQSGGPFIFRTTWKSGATILASITSLHKSKVRCGVLTYLACLATTTLAWRLCMLTSQWAVCVFSRLANSLCLCFLSLFSILLIRIMVRNPKSLWTPLFALSGNIFGLAVLIVSIVYVGTQEAPLGRLWVSLMLLLYFIASLRLAWPLSRLAEHTDAKSEAKMGSPMREMRQSTQQTPNDTTDDQHAVVVDALQRRESNGSNMSNTSASTVSTGILQMDSVGDAVGVCASEGYQYKGPIPKIYIHPNTSKTTFGSGRPDTARSNYSCTTSGISTDSDQVHTASAQLFEAAVGVKSNEPARLVRLITTAKKLETMKTVPIFMSKEDFQVAALEMPSSPTSAASSMGDNDERELLSHGNDIAGDVGMGRRRMAGHPLRPRPAHSSRILKRPSFTSPALEGKSAPQFGQLADSLARPASADAYHQLTACSSTPFAQHFLPSPPTKAA